MDAKSYCQNSSFVIPFTVRRVPENVTLVLTAIKANNHTCFKGISIWVYILYLLTPWCRVLLEKLTGLQLVKRFPAFYGTRRFITAFTSFRHMPTTHLLEIHPNIIHPSTPRSPQRSLSLRFPHQDLIRPPLLPHTSHMPSPSHSS